MSGMTDDLAALNDLLVGVEMDRHSLPDGDAKVAALGRAIARLRGEAQGEQQAPDTESAYAMGAKGGPANDAERLAFESWMRGHCWALCATWNGTGYVSDAEQAGDFCAHASNTRRLWAAWRDRAALSSTAAPVGVEGLPQPFGYVEPRHDLSGYEVFDEPSPRRAAIWNMHGMRKALAQTRAHYSIDADPDGIRERVSDAITGALSFGAQGVHKPPAGHWLEPFWDMARAEREATVPPTVDEATARRLDDYLGGEFDIRIGKQAAHAALVHALAQDRASQAGAAVPDGYALVPTHWRESLLVSAGLLEVAKCPIDALQAKALRKMADQIAAAPTPAAEREVQ